MPPDKDHVLPDSSTEIRPARSSLGRLALLGAGHLFVALGVIGAVLPVMPTTVFLLLAAACYVRASPKFYNRLLSHPTFGPVIADWRTQRAMSRRNKLVAIALVIVTVGGSILLCPLPAVKLVLGGIGLSVIVFLLGISTKP